MIISDTAIKNRTVVFVVVIFMILAGLYSYNTLPRESAPDIKIPYVFVSTAYKGVSSKDIETLITIPIEKKLKGLKNVKEIRSSSTEGLSSISVEFVTETNIDDAVRWVKDKVDMAKRELPTDLEDDPSVFEVNISEMPILILAFSADFELRRLKKIAEDIEEEIEAIPGVLEVELAGGREREIHFEVDPDLLAIYGIPFDVFYLAVSKGNQNVSGGNIAMGDGRYQISVPGEFNSIESFQELIITVVDGSPVYLRDVAVVKDTYKDITSESKFNLKNSVNLYIKKRVGENIIYIVDDVKKLLDEKQKTFPDGLIVTKLMDQSNEIRMMISDLENNIISGLILVIIVLMFSMGLRNSILVSISIPLSMLLSFSILQAFNITLNMVTLFSLILALGMLVDNSIVIVENIYRFVQDGMPKVEAAIHATREVAIAVIASAITTIAAFLPLINWPGIMGAFMKFLPITLVITLASSLIVAITINPVFCSVFIKKTKGKKNANEANKEGSILKSYRSVLEVSLRHPFMILFSSVLVLMVLVYVWLLRTGVDRPIEFFPSTEPNICYVNIDVPQGTGMETLKSISEEIENRIMSIDNVPPDYVSELSKPPKLIKIEEENFNSYLVGKGRVHEEKVSDFQNIRFIYTKLSTQAGGEAAFGNSTLPNHIGIQFHDYLGRVESSKVTINRIRERLRGIAGANIYLAEEQQGPPTGAPINIEISGDNFDVLGRIASKVKEVVKEVPYVKDIEDDFAEGIPTIELLVDRKKASLYGLTVGDIGTAIKTAFNGWNISTYREQNEDYDIILIAKKEYRDNIDILRKLYITSMEHGAIPLSDLVTMNYTSGLGSINRINHSRVVTVKAEVDEMNIPGAVAQKIAQRMLKTFVPPPGYNIAFTGENKAQEDAQKFLSKAFMTALCLIFIVLVMQFNSIVHPFIILCSVILSLGGVFLGLAIGNIPFGVVMTGVGVISLAGVVVNNAIVLLDYTQKLLNKNLTLIDAVIQAGVTRFRPVMLTAITTTIGLLPMITGISFDFRNFVWIMSSESNQMWFSMAIAVAFGLIVATALTLVVVPVMFYLCISIKIKILNIFQKAHIIDEVLPLSETGGSN